MKITNHIVKQWYDFTDNKTYHSKWECGCVSKTTKIYWPNGIIGVGEEGFSYRNPNCKAEHH